MELRDEYLDGDPYNVDLENDLPYVRGMEIAINLFKGKNGKILDIGCGEGHITARLSNLNLDISGMDLSKKAIKNANKKYGTVINFIVGDACFIPLKSSSFDNVNAFHIIEHVKDYRQFLKEVSRILKQNGFLIIATPNLLRTTNVLRKYILHKPYKFRHPLHIKEFEFNELEILLRRFGFSIVKKEGIYPFLQLKGGLKTILFCFFKFLLHNLLKTIGLNQCDNIYILAKKNVI